jgi:hypothetical protein
MSFHNSQSIVSAQLAAQTVLLHRIASIKWRAALKSRAGYILYLQAAYQYVIASAPLLRAAASTPFFSSHPDIREYLLRHADEEDGEDRWLIQDLEALGAQTSPTTICTPQTSPVITMVGTQYYRIFHQCPASILGYMYALESAPPTPDFLEELATDLQLPVSAMRSLRAHSQNDPLHREEICDVVDRLNIRTTCAQELALAARHTLSRLIDCYDQICRMGDKGQQCTLP